MRKGRMNKIMTKPIKITKLENRIERSKQVTENKIIRNNYTKINYDEVKIHHNIEKPTEYATVKPIMKGQTVFIIGGGPSLSNFNWESLNEKNVIAVNKAALTYAQADILYWTDSRFYTWYHDFIDNEFKGIKYTISKNALHSNDINILIKGMKYGLEENKSTIAHGENSGYAAINLAYHLGASKIVLLGYDMGNLGGNSHYHDGYPVKHTPDEIYERRFLPGFQIIGNILKSKGIEIYNASLNSKIQCFPKITHHQAISL